MSMKNKKHFCPACWKELTDEEYKKLKCTACKNYLIEENGKLRVPKYKDE